MKTAFLFDMKMPGASRAADWLQKNGYQVDGAMTGEMTEEALQQLERRSSGSARYLPGYGLWSL